MPQATPLSVQSGLRRRRLMPTAQREGKHTMGRWAKHSVQSRSAGASPDTKTETHMHHSPRPASVLHGGGEGGGADHRGSRQWHTVQKVRAAWLLGEGAGTEAGLPQCRHALQAAPLLGSGVL